MKLKKIVCIMMSFLIVFGSIATGVSATNGLKSELIVTEKNSGDVYFDAQYAQIGKEISVLVKGRESEHFIYEWYLNNERIENVTDSYTPQWCDLEMMLTVKVYEKTGSAFVGNVSMLISELPVIYIETDEREPIVIKEKELDAHLKIQGNEQYNDEDMLYDDATKIKGRGNTTWMDDKKPYKLKLDSKADLFGMGKNKHWVLLSNPYDTTHARNLVSYDLAKKMGLGYQEAIPVDLVLNGAHLGNFVLAEHVRVDDNRVEITNWDDIAEDAAKAIYKGNKDTMTKDERDELIDYMTDVTKDWTTSDSVTFNGVTYTISDYFEVPDINGGYLIKIEKDGSYISKKDISIVIDRPEVYSEDMYNSITGYYQAYEDALFSDDFSTEYNGKTMHYTEFIDVESFAKGILLNELFMNKDFAARSTYMSKEIDGKLVYGPVWDMDFSSGSSPSTDYYNIWHSLQHKTLIKRLFADPYMLNEIRNYYWEYRYTYIADMIKQGGTIDTTYDLLSSSSKRDEEIWNYDAGFDYEYESFINWMNQRIAWLDVQFASLSSLYKSMKPSLINSHVSDQKNMELSLNGDSLNVTLSDNSVKSISVFADGVLLKSEAVIDSNQNIDTAKADSDAMLTVIGYDENGNVVCGNYISKEKKITSLEVTTLPDKLNYNINDSLDLTGLVLEATYSDSSKESVEPDAAITYVKDAVGEQFLTHYNTVTDFYGEEVYVSLRYKDAKAEFKINVAPRENYEEVENLINKFPYENFDEDYIEEIITAKLAFDSLSAEAKEKVSNKDKLEKVMSCIDSVAQEPGSGFLACYMPSLYESYMKNDFVFLVKGTPSKIRFFTEANSTITINETSSSRISYKEIGDYSLWTCNLASQKLNAVVIYSSSNHSDPKSFDLNEIGNQNKKFISADYQKAVSEGDTLSFDVETYKKLDGLRISENGSEIKTIVPSSAESSISFTPSSLGNHTYTLEYCVDGYWIEYGDFDVYVREKAVNLILGDTDLNRQINSSDALMVLQYATGLIEFDNDQIKNADTYTDTKINSTDALYILLFTTGQLEKF